MFNNILLALAVSVSVAACVETPMSPSDADSDRLLVQDHVDLDALDDVQPATRDEVKRRQDALKRIKDAGDSLAPTDDACAVADDADALRTYIPAGWCVTFACYTEGGEPIRAGGCNFEEPSLSTSSKVQPELGFSSTRAITNE